MDTCSERYRIIRGAVVLLLVATLLAVAVLHYLVPPYQAPALAYIGVSTASSCTMLILTGREAAR